MADQLTIGGIDIRRGERRSVDVTLPRLYTHTEMTMSVQVCRGRGGNGPVLLLCSGLHGDEINGMEIIRQVMSRLDSRQLRGTVVAVPVVNVFGFINQSRYLPDRRDLNRSFPGSANGSLAARLAYIFMNEVVSHCTHGIDLHTAALDRINLPQLRGDLNDEATRMCAEAFGVPVIIQAATRDGSLREAAVRRGIKMLLYEAGEPLRFNAEAIDTGVRGVLRMMAMLGMRRGPKRPRPGSFVEVGATTWVRARRSGVLRLNVALGDRVRRGQTLGIISDPFDEHQRTVSAPKAGLVIGRTNNPLVHTGDAIVHLGLPLAG